VTSQQPYPNHLWHHGHRPHHHHQQQQGWVPGHDQQLRRAPVNYTAHHKRSQQQSDSSGYSRGEERPAGKPKQKRARAGAGLGSGKGSRGPAKEVDPDTAAALTALTLLAHDGEGVRRFISAAAQEADGTAANLGDREEVRAARGPQAASRCIGVTWRERIQRWEVSRGAEGGHVAWRTCCMSPGWGWVCNG
jgi:hypothetical protein